jgi:hypothetical protein
MTPCGCFARRVDCHAMALEALQQDRQYLTV